MWETWLTRVGARALLVHLESVSMSPFTLLGKVICWVGIRVILTLIVSSNT
jgi:hypothetical protein